MSNRRDFLKTLGKLGAAVGLTAAVTATVKPTIDATPKPTNAASLEATSRGKNTLKGYPGLTASEQAYEKKYEFGFTGFKKPNTMLDVNDVTRQAQDAITRIENLRLDNLRMRIDPPHFLTEPDRFVSPHLRHQFNSALERPFAESVRITHQQMLLKELDPYNWGDVFDLTWDGWKTMPDRYMLQGCWTARVKARYRDLFGDVGVWRRSCSVAKEAVYKHAAAHPRDRTGGECEFLNYSKDGAYEDIIREIKKAIQWFVDNRDGHTFEELKALPRPDLT